MNSTTSIKILLLALATCLISTVLPRPVQAQGGAGSKGGVVLACFVSDPTKFMQPVFPEVANDPKRQDEPRAKIYKWPDVAEDPNDPRVGYASRAIVFDAVNRLSFVQVAEYYLATVDSSWGGTDQLYGNGTYHLHPLLFLINDLPQSKKAVPDANFLTLKGVDGRPVPFPPEKLPSTATWTPEDEEQVFSYVETEEARIKKDKDQNTPVFNSMYGLVSNMFRGLPGFYTRLQAAHDLLGLIPNHESKLSGSKSDQWDSKNLTALASLPKAPSKCLWMTAADRVGDTIIYDRYLWQRMDLFQRVLLQLHEEVYYMGSDARGLGLYQGNVEPTRFMLTRFLRGERSDRDQSGDFVSNCAFYDNSTNGRTPSVKLVESTGCQLLSPGLERGPIKGPDASFLPTGKSGADATAFVNQFICTGPLGCMDDRMKTWEKIARYYGPYSSGTLQALMLNTDHFFGRYSTIDRLVEKRDRAYQVVTNMLAPYDTVYGYCAKGGYYSTDDTTGPQPAKNNARRLERKERERLEKKEENLNYTPRSDEPVIKKSDLEEIKFENAVYKDLRVKVGNNVELQMLQQSLGLLDDFPDKMLTDPIAALLLLKAPDSFIAASDLEPGKGGKNLSQVGDVCNDVKERRRKLAAFLKITGTTKDPALTFYERPDDSPLDIKIPH